MFTIGDIRNIAVQIEKNGEETYRKTSEAVDDPQLKEMLDWMADEEKRHAQWFSSLKSEKPLTEEQRELENVGRTLLQDMIKGSTFLLDPDKLKNSSTLKELIDQSIAFEEDPVLFYEFLQGFLDDQEAVEQLQKIITEERNHAKQLQELATPLLCQD